jgi:hypothetical protein
MQTQTWLEANEELSAKENGVVTQGTEPMLVGTILAPAPIGVTHSPQVATGLAATREAEGASNIPPAAAAAAISQ